MGKLLNFLKRLDVIIVTLLMFGIFINVMLQILSRILPFRVVPWTVEMGEILLAAVIWMGIGLGVLSNSHVRFDLLLSKLPYKKKKFLYIVGNIIFAIFLLILAYHAISLLEFYIKSNTRTPQLRWNRAYIRAPVLIGCVIGAVRMLIQAWFFAKDKIPLPTGEAEEVRSILEANQKEGEQ